jgi:hypothetical protein
MRQRLALLVAGSLAVWVGVACAVSPGQAAQVAPASDAALFEREVRPLLQRACLGCHGVDARLGGLDLRSRAGAAKGGTRGPAIVPGDAARSPLFQLVSGARAPLMPPAGKLPAADIALLKRWIQAGAPWPDGSTETAAKQVWWSFRPPREPAVPNLNSAWVRTPVDAFVLARLRKEGLTPSPPAPRRTLIRRAYLDMLGLPPTPEEVRAFEADRSADAWEKVVDRLLASPHYGERWGRHWLDLVRYADSSGFEGDKDRPLAWRYRDYVIRSFNEDKPYDRFLTEQLAGDEVRPGDPEALVATGYLACGIEDFAMAKLPTTRADELDDLVSTTGQAMLGLTLGCARCHDHKYDPVSHVDYYRLQALFAPTERREVPIPTPAERAAYEERERALQAELAPLRAEAAPYEQQAAKLLPASPRPTPEQIQQALPEPAKGAYAALLARMKAVEARRVPLPMALTVTDKSREWQPVHLLLRGDAYHPGPVVQPGFLTRLPGGAVEVGKEAATATTTGRRKALAAWLTAPDHPLTSRVWMNRVWRQHFGRGLVNTPSNFGVNGDLPSHPELLDWLAVRFARGPDPWRLKPIHRLLLLSSTYCQASAIRPEAAAKDPQNRWLWRIPVRRLEAEAVRDSILAVAGSLNREMGGPPVYPPVDPSLRADTFQGPNWPEGEDGPKTWRRSVYVKVKRSLLFPQLEAFDCPEITASVAQRNVTTTPSQALLMLNDPLIHRQAGLFAERVAREAGPEPARQVRHAYLVALGREPTRREAELGLAFLRRPAVSGGPPPLTALCHAILNLSEFVYSS